jgi:hypothetical protein
VTLPGIIVFVQRFLSSFFALALSALILITLTAAGCGKNIQNPDAVKQGVMDYLKERASTMGLNMDAMDATVNSVSFEKDVARAAVMFSVKGAPGGGMSMEYVLDRKGDKWVVRSKQMSSPPAGGPSGASPADALPPGHPPTDKK